MNNKEKNYVLATHRNNTHPLEQYYLDKATGKLIAGARELSGGRAKLGSAGALEILYELGRLMNKLDD